MVHVAKYHTINEYVSGGKNQLPHVSSFQPRAYEEFLASYDV